jgi:hypothetical protein
MLQLALREPEPCRASRRQMLQRNDAQNNIRVNTRLSSHLNRVLGLRLNNLGLSLTVLLPFTRVARS